MTACTSGGPTVRAEVLLVFTALCAAGLPSTRGPRRTSEPGVSSASTTARAGRLRELLGRRRLLRTRCEALPLALELLARELRSGVTIVFAFEHVALTADPALDVPALVERLRHGSGLAPAVDWWVARFDDEDASVIAGVFHLGTETGTAVADALDRAAASIRARSELSAEVSALTAQSRASAVMVGAAPVGFGLLLAFAEPSAMSFLFGSVSGLACLIVGLGLDAAGFWWMQRLVARVAP